MVEAAVAAAAGMDAEDVDEVRAAAAIVVLAVVVAAEIAAATRKP
jgi:hypothetical protein